MRLLVELSAEHPTLPRAELEATLALVDGRVLETDGAVALAEAPPQAAAFLASRLALAHSVSEHWWSGEASPPAMREPFAERDMQGASFAVRARRLEGAHPELGLQELVREAGARLGRTGKVDLQSPDVDVRVLVSGRAHVGRLLAEVDRKAFDARHVKHRAHFAPVSLHPRYARTLVNLAGVRPSDVIADPFVGTGGLALEAGLVGARVVAGDLDPRMVAGTRETLERAGVVDARVEARDVGELPEWTGGKLDAVLSDPPYGRASTTNREAMDGLYERFFAAAHAALKPGGRLAAIFPSDALRQRAAATFRLLQTHDQRVHRSMTRHWAVYARD